MWHFIHLVGAPAGFFLGLFFVLTAIVLYPNEEGKLQSKFEDLWVRVDDYQEQALSKHAAFMQQIAKLETRFLDRVFGRKLFSAQALGVSFACSVGLVSIWSIIMREANRIYLILESYFAWPLLICSLVVGMANILIRRQKLARRIIVIGALIPLVVLLNRRSNSPLTDAVELLSLIVSMLLGFACDVVFIAVTRRLLRWAGQMNSFLALLATVVLNLLLAAFLVSPIMGRFFLLNRGDIFVYFLTPVAIGNIFDVALSLLFVLLVAIMLIHRALWPLLSRTLFRMADIGTKGRRGVLVTVGLALLGWSGTKLPDLVKDLVKAFGG